MKAMIFAAGLGSRLKPFTLSHPKALVPVGGVPMLERVILKLREAGVTEMVVNVHHFADQIVMFLREHNNFGISITVSDERDLLLDTGGGLLKAAEWLKGDEPVLIHNADILTDFPVAEMLSTHLQEGADATLLVDNRESSRCLYFDADSRMHGWGNLKSGETKPAGLDTAGLQPRAFGGVHIINPATVLPALEEYSNTKVFSIIDFYVALCGKLRFMGYTPARPYTWLDVGKPERLARANELMG